MTSSSSWNIQPHTVLMTVGPTRAGKTTFCKEYLLPALPGKVVYLASDDLRREHMNPGYSNDSKEMLAMSYLAFEQLFSRLTSYMTWPSAVEFIVLDTTGLAESFRQRVISVCTEKCYTVVPVIFDFKSYDDYMLYAVDKSTIARQITTLRHQVLPKIGCEFKGQRIFFVKSRDFQQYQIHVPSWYLYTSCFVPATLRPIVIGNVNGCYEELRLLLESFRVKFAEDGITMLSPHPVVLIGNPFGKAIANRSTGRDSIPLGKGNLDSQMLAWIQANPVYCVTRDILPEGIPTYPFLSIRYRWIITERFVERKYLLKQNPGPIFAQIDKAEGVYNEPLRIFGSFPTEKFERRDNLYAMDGGCVHGGTLHGIGLFETAVIVKHQAALKTYSPGVLNRLFPHEIELKTYADLSPPMQYRYNKIIRAGAPFLSGTMSPAPADPQAKIISPEAFESLEQALLYYKNHRVTQVCLQPKYMGSRCTMILNRNGSSYAISRGGFSIRIPGMAKLLAELETQYLTGDIAIAIIDGELLPWVAMAKTLVEDVFRTVDVGIQQDLQGLREYGFDTVLTQLEAARNQIKGPLKSKDAALNQGTYHTLMAYDGLMSQWVDIEEMDRGSRIYSSQLELFSQDGPLEFKPFALLKTIHTDGREHVYAEPTSINFQRVSTDACRVVSVEDLRAAEDFYDRITQDRQMEGIVVKPETNPVTRAVPYLKVRNRNYLTLIYGPSYQDPRRLEELIRRKKVAAKQRLSRLQYEIAQEILQIPFSELGPNNERYCGLVATFLQSNEDEATVDPRL